MSYLCILKKNSELNTKILVSKGGTDFFSVSEAERVAYMYINTSNQTSRICLINSMDPVLFQSLQPS